MPFLSGDGQLAKMIRDFDWASTPLGPLGDWPQSLKTATSLLVASPVPMVMLWGSSGVMIYNDAYSVFAGSRHPELLGSNVREGWEEVAEFNDNVMKVGLAGGVLSYREQELVLYRHGRSDTAWLDLDYSPVFDESGRPGGVIAIVLEVTDRVVAARRIAAEQERQRQMLQQMPGFIALLSGPDFVYDYVNDAYVQISERSDFVGRRFRDVFPDIEGQGFFELIERVYNTGEGVVMRNMELRLHGSEEAQYIDFTFEPIRDDSGAVNGIFIGGYETTEAHRATLSLRASETALRSLNEHLEREVTSRSHVGGKTWTLSPEMLGVCNDQGFFESSNPAWQDVLGWTAAEIARTPLFELIHPDDLDATILAFKTLERGEPVLRFENRYRRITGDYRWLSWVAVPDDGKFYCSARDITEQKAAEDERQQLWSLSQDMLGRATYDGRMTAVNPAWTEVLGWSEHELLTNPYADIMHPEDVETTLAALTAMGESGSPTRFENRILTKTGEWKPIDWTVTPERGSDRFIAIGRDLSADKIRQRELAEAQDALRQSQKMEAVGQLTGGLAHDFNNLLTGIGGSLEMMQMRLAQGRLDTVERYSTAAQGAVRRAAALTHRLLAFSRRQTLDPTPTNVNRLVADMEELIRRTMGPAIHVEIVGAGGIWPTLVDANQLENALLNLAINARDAMPDGGRLTIETANKWLDERTGRDHDLPPGQYVSLCVTDTGTGMSPDVAAKAFDPFFTTKPLGEGTGLGLSMIYGFARQSGGQVRIYSEVGSGTTMCIYLPRHDIDLPPESDAVSAASPDISGDGEVVLVIDDEPTIRMLIGEVLADAGYAAIEAADGPTGLKILQSDARIDLLITDVGLPGGLNGRQVADAARVARPDLKILFVTGYAENAVVGNGHLERGMSLITKPFQMDDLAKKIGEALA